MKSGFSCPHCGNGLEVEKGADGDLHLQCGHCHDQYQWWEDGNGFAELLLVNSGG